MANQTCYEDTANKIGHSTGLDDFDIMLTWAMNDQRGIILNNSYLRLQKNTEICPFKFKVYATLHTKNEVCTLIYICEANNHTESPKAML